MSNLSNQVLFSSGYKNIHKNWWTSSGKLSQNFYFLIYASNQKKINTPKLLFSLKKEIKKTKTHNLKSLKKVLKLENFNSKEISLCLVITNKNKLTLVSKGKFKAKLFKNNTITSLPLSKLGLKGKLSKGDKLFISNSKTLSLINLKNAIDSKKLKTESINSSDPINYLILENKPQFQFKLSSLKKPTLPKINKDIFKTKKINKKLFTPRISLRQKKASVLSKKRFYALILASSFLLLLGFSLGFGSYKKRKVVNEQKQKELIENIIYKLQQAESLKNLNPSRAKTLLKDAKDTLDSYYQTHKNDNLDLEKLTQKVSESYALVTHQYLVENPKVFYDLTLAKKNFIPTSFSLSEFDLTLFDSQNKNLLLLDIKNKSNEIIGGEDFIGKENYLASNENWIFLATGNSLQIIDKEKKEQIDSFKLEKISIDGFLGYASNAYILDKTLGQVWRLRGTSKTLQKPDSFFLKDQDLSGVISFSLDGSLWFLLEDGSLEKYTSGVRDALYPAYTFGLDDPLISPDKLYTDEYCDNLYVLEKQKSRILSFSKQGKYNGQYLWDKIGEISDFVVSEQIGQILLLLDDKIYGVEIKN